MDKKSKNKLIAVSVYAVAMGFVEAAVVVYLRQLFYSSGFSFPIAGFLNPSVIAVEWFREISTLVMLLAVGYLAGKNLRQKFAYFIYASALWDIFYYVFLKAALNWPQSLFSWDLLFLIPWPWVGPVIAPVICSILMIAAALIILLNNRKKMKIEKQDWLLVLSGMFLVVLTWIYDYGKLIVSNGYLDKFFTLSSNAGFMSLVSSYTPVSYNYPVFFAGIILAVIGIAGFYFRNR